MKHILTTAIAALLLAACAQNNQPAHTLYYWGDFNKQQYQTLNNALTPQEQIANMEKYFLDAQSNQAKAAPGTHAHLGMLYAKVGNLAGAKTQFEMEKQAFPESTAYMNFLLKNVAGVKS
ncbi:DUF4810 domain-containing protein [Snodgrassella alvi]|uniref:DUF4810 domain-containing protein n=1 Tax=Snodgrassella TaxID=1193515 RepID=UPI00226A232A|nr:DUF4810 domain-containing protein [Snodgrassella sp. B3837]MCT6881524.1 DUF4810 domain-containing protein [Snodgrassella alvi]MCX8753717.1 DUF4810 domain-containing protein [Snodgrassella sp. B3837]